LLLEVATKDIGALATFRGASVDRQEACAEALLLGEALLFRRGGTIDLLSRKVAPNGVAAGDSDHALGADLFAIYICIS
jgi:hypothetical protein